MGVSERKMGVALKNFSWARTLPPPIGSFCSKTWTSFKPQLLFYVLELSNFPASSLLETWSQTDLFSKNSLLSGISIICDYANIAFCFHSRRPIFAARPQKYTFKVVSLRERTIVLSRLAKVLKLISLYHLRPRTKELWA